jgi:hypothetical protein
MSLRSGLSRRSDGFARREALVTPLWPGRDEMSTKPEAIAASAVVAGPIDVRLVDIGHVIQNSTCDDVANTNNHKVAACLALVSWRKSTFVTSRRS